jgi:hypothetical protein
MTVAEYASARQDLRFVLVGRPEDAMLPTTISDASFGSRLS